VLNPSDELEGEIGINLTDRSCEIALCLADTVKEDYKAELHIPIEPTPEFKSIAGRYLSELVFGKTA
jgi:hypothetical protein